MFQFYSIYHTFKKFIIISVEFSACNCVTVGMSVNVIIVGAGPAGLMAAYRFKSRGFKVTIIERREHLCADVGGAYDISGNCKKVFEKAGLGQELEDLGGKINGFYLVDSTTGNIFKKKDF